MSKETRGLSILGYNKLADKLEADCVKWGEMYQKLEDENETLSSHIETLEAELAVAESFHKVAIQQRDTANKRIEELEAENRIFRNTESVDDSVWDALLEQVRQLQRKDDELVDRLHVLIVRAFTDGYGRGHDDTVEGDYTDVLPRDRDTYFSEDVDEWVREQPELKALLEQEEGDERNG